MRDGGRTDVTHLLGVEDRTRCYDRYVAFFFLAFFFFFFLDDGGSLIDPKSSDSCHSCFADMTVLYNLGHRVVP